MENYENELFPQEQPAQEPIPKEPAAQEPTQPAQEQVQPAQEQVQPVYESAPYQQPYHGTGAGRKESPFADSPYVTAASRVAPQPAKEQNAYVPPVPPQEPPRKPKKQRTSGGKVWKAVLCVVLAVALVAGSCGFTAYFVNRKWEEKTDSITATFNQRLDEMQKEIDNANKLPDTIIGYPEVSYTVTAPGAIYENNVRSVVMITAEMKTVMYGQTTTAMSSGSGFVLSEDGYVVTNHHVVEGATDVTVTLNDGTEYAATLIGSDSTNDVALLKVEEDVTLKAVTIGSSDALRVGDQVVAIGNPLGELTSTLTVGYVSAKERDVTTEGTTINMIQTDAAINSGNSGGPLFNSQGEVVGITTAKYSGSSSSGASIEGIGFAIPIDDVMPLVDDLMNYGYINSAFLGIMVSEMDAQTAAYWGLPVGGYVQEVTPGSCAEKAGLQPKDIIIALGEYEVDGISDLTKALRKFKAGETTTLKVFRGGQELTLTVTLDEKPREETAVTAPIPDKNQMPEEGNYEDWFEYFAPFFDGRG